MKKYIISCAALFAMSFYGHAQVGIGTKNPKSFTALDMSALKNKGVLFPQVSLSDLKSTSPINGTIDKGLLVYNSNPVVNGVSGDAIGFYQWNGLVWEKLVSQAEVVKLIKENVGESTESLVELLKVIVNKGEGKLEGSSVVLYDFDKKEFYTLIRDEKGKVITSKSIDLGFNDVIRYKVIDGQTVLVYKDKDGKEQTLDINNLQVDTFIRDLKDKNGKVTGYIYFGEEAVSKWIKANPKDAHRVKTDIPDSEGKTLDIVGSVTNNLQEILESKKDFFTTFITEIKGNVTVKTEGDRVYLVYKDDKGNDIKIDLSQLETETFVRTISQEVDGKKRVMGYVHFNEGQINKWIKANPALASVYKDQMKNEDGTYIDIIGAVTNNFKEIIEKNEEYLTTIINETKGNVTVKTENGKTYLVYRDAKGNEVKLDLSSMEIVTFIRPVKTKNAKNEEKVTGYVYFNEESIALWLKDNPLLAPLYQTQMPDAAGVILDVVGSVSNNFEDIINKEENKKYITNVINQSEGNVTVKVVDGKTVLVFKDKDGKEQVVDFSAVETETYIKEVLDAAGKKVTGYVYFSEEAINKWRKANPGKDYKTQMLPADGKLIDVFGTVSNNFQEILNEGDNIKNITEVINKTGGNVSIKVDASGKTVLVYLDKDGKEQVVDLSGNETLTFIRDVKKTVKVDGKDVEKIAGYVYFSEEAISKWIKDNTGKLDTKLYKDLMKDSDGKLIDVIGTVSQNFQEIINEGDNIKNITEVINKAGGNVSVKVDANGKTVLVYLDKDGKEQVVDLSGNETLTFIRDVKKTVKVDGKDVEKVAGYVYFSEEAISKWIKDNTGKLDTKLYKDLMKDSDGKLIDVIGTVSQNFQEIINEGDNIKNITEVINKAGGNVSVKVDENGKTVLVYLDKDGKEQVVDLSSNETETYLKDIVDSKTNKITGYIYFSEEAITKWRKNPANKGKDYKKDMVAADGKVIDVFGTVSNNFQEILNEGDNIKNITEVINKTGGNVSVKIDENGKAVLIYLDKDGKEQVVDLSSNETDTFIRVVKDTKDPKKTLKYIYFGEAKIAAWVKANKNDAAKYKDLMPESEGIVLDILTDISYNLEEVINNNTDAFNKIINEYLSKGGNVYYGDVNGKEVLYTLVKDKTTGEEKKEPVNLAESIKEVITTNTEFLKELRESVGYNISSEVVETGIKFEKKVVSTFSGLVEIEELDAEVKGLKLPKTLFSEPINIFDIKLYTEGGSLVTVNITDIIVKDTTIEFSLGSGVFYTTLPKAKYKAVVYFTK